MDTKQLLKGIDRACLFASDGKNNNIYLEIKESSKISIYSNTKEVGKIEETQHIKEIQGGKELRLSLNGNFLMDVLKVIDEEDIRISFNGHMKPILLQPNGKIDHLHLISPVRTY